MPFETKRRRGWLGGRQLQVEPGTTHKHGSVHICVYMHRQVCVLCMHIHVCVWCVGGQTQGFENAGQTVCPLTRTLSPTVGS